MKIRLFSTLLLIIINQLLRRGMQINMSAGLLDYVTYKYVVLKDRRLGVAYYVLAVAILIFTVTEVFVRKGYLEVITMGQLDAISNQYSTSISFQIDSNPQGVVRAVVSEELSNEYRNNSKPDYCDLNISCQYYDPLELNWPMEGRAVTITTFAKEKHQKLLPQGTQYEVVQESKYYTLVCSITAETINYVLIYVKGGPSGSFSLSAEGAETIQSVTYTTYCYNIMRGS